MPFSEYLEEIFLQLYKGEGGAIFSEGNRSNKIEIVQYFINTF
jgi:hypothetical protein